MRGRDSAQMIAVVDYLLLLRVIGYSFAEHLFATCIKNVLFRVHSDHVRGNDVAVDSVVNCAWHYVTVCTNDLRFAHIFEATFLVHVIYDCAFVVICLMDGGVIRLLGGIVVSSDYWMSVYLFIRCYMLLYVISD